MFVNAHAQALTAHRRKARSRHPPCEVNIHCNEGTFYKSAIYNIYKDDKLRENEMFVIVERTKNVTKRPKIFYAVSGLAANFILNITLYYSLNFLRR